MNRTSVLLVEGVSDNRDGGAVPAVHIGPAAGPLAVVVLLASLAATVGLADAGWAVGITCGLVTCVLIGRGMTVVEATRLGPADRVTLTRVVLTCAVAALAATSYVEPVPSAALVVLAVVALALDAVDGRVARRTGTVSTFGARFDGEADAFLILVLSVYVADVAGAWVLAIGAARYAFLAAGWVLPYLRGPLPPRYWRKVVAAAQGIALTIAASGVLPASWASELLVLAVALLAESFGRDVIWLWRRRCVAGVGPRPAPRTGAAPVAPGM
jgi:phosphatidylglycerophosphate synthase